MNRTLLIISALTVTLLGCVGALFVIQNSSRTTELSLDLWFTAFQLQEPAPVLALMGISALLGAVVVGLPLVLRLWRQAGRLRALQQQVDIADVQSEWR